MVFNTQALDERSIEGASSRRFSFDEGKEEVLALPSEVEQTGGFLEGPRWRLSTVNSFVPCIVDESGNSSTSSSPTTPNNPGTTLVLDDMLSLSPLSKLIAELRNEFEALPPGDLDDDIELCQEVTLCQEDRGRERMLQVPTQAATATRTVSRTPAAVSRWQSCKARIVSAADFKEESCA